MTFQLNLLLTNQNSRMDIWSRTHASVLDSVKSDLNKEDLVEEIETIWADLSIENNNLHRLEATHIKDLFELY